MAAARQAARPVFSSAEADRLVNLLTTSDQFLVVTRLRDAFQRGVTAGGTNPATRARYVDAVNVLTSNPTAGGLKIVLTGTDLDIGEEIAAALGLSRDGIRDLYRRAGIAVSGSSMPSLPPPRQATQSPRQASQSLKGLDDAPQASVTASPVVMPGTAAVTRLPPPPVPAMRSWARRNWKPLALAASGVATLVWFKRRR